jgi:hypothetical protein
MTWLCESLGAFLAGYDDAPKRLKAGTATAVR